jgi:hypothetical protein
MLSPFGQDPAERHAGYHPEKTSKGSQDVERGYLDLEVIDAFGKVGTSWEVLAENAVGVLVGSRCHGVRGPQK